MHVAVVGARGFLGRELVRLLLDHPDVDELTVASTSAHGDHLGATEPSLAHVPDLEMVAPTDASVTGADVVMLATPGGAAQAIMPDLDHAGVPTVIDLSRDHRHTALAGTGPWQYAVPDLWPPTTGGPVRIANAGCYPTATLLATVPLLWTGCLGDGPVVVNGISGVSGAGATPRPDLHFPNVHGSVRAYKVVGHDHQDEMRAALSRASPRNAPVVHFTPHLAPMNRGLLATVVAPAAPGATDADLAAAYGKAYEDTAFVHVVDEPATSNVQRSNVAHVAAHVDPDTGHVVARCAIDNMQKGGAASAVHNMNLATGRPAGAGLGHIGGGP